MQSNKSFWTIPMISHTSGNTGTSYIQGNFMFIAHPVASITSQVNSTEILLKGRKRIPHG